MFNRFSSVNTRSLCALTCALAVIASGCIDKRITVRFDSQAIGSPINPVNIGTAGDFTDIDVMSINGGEVVGVAGITGNGSAADFPDHSTGPTSPRAVVKITNTANLELLTPLERDFWFGADVNLDAVNATPGSNDDGNNIMQRGLFNETSQFKIEIDANTPTCRLKGVDGAVFLQGNNIVTGNDYRIRCERIGTTARLLVWPIEADGSLGPALTDTAQTADIGSLEFAATIPMSIGGKLRNNGEVNPSTDQFNGTIDNAILRIDFPEYEDPEE